MNMSLIQYLTDQGNIAVGRACDEQVVEELNTQETLYDLAQRAIADRITLRECVEKLRSGRSLNYETLIREGRLLPPLHHPDPAHLIVSGTGLTHLGSADTRANMHAQMAKQAEELTDSMRMFQMGVEGGKPNLSEVGAQPEWFYKGDGSIVTPPGGDITAPAFGLDFGDEAEVVGLYIISADGIPHRLGFALGNEFSDHKMEKINYLYLAHSKLRPCSFGPELRLGSLPDQIEGSSRIYRNGQIAWEKPFCTGEANMSHSIANLEHHHFKYEGFLRPGDIHIHFFGTSTLSFGDQFEAEPGDTFELACSEFGRPLRNTLLASPRPDEELVKVVEL